MNRKTNSGTISRRHFVGGTLVGGAALMGVGGPALAAATSRMSGLSSDGAGGKGAGGDCHLRHAAMAEALSRTIADPAVDAAATALAIRTNHCPCCGTQIGAGFHAEGVAA